MRILILGGTEEARVLAGRLVAMGHEVTTSLKGVTASPLVPEGDLRVGGFGGVEGLRDTLIRGRFERLVDATHPYAVRIKRHAVEAAAATDVPLVRMSRPEWAELPGVRWWHVGDASGAAASLPPGAVVLLTIGHRDLEPFFARTDCRFLIRTIEPLAHTLPPGVRAILDRPPYFIRAERALMEAEGITHLVSKNSGGVQTHAKLEAAAELGVTVVMIDRPALLPAAEQPTIGQVIAALRLQRS